MIHEDKTERVDRSLAVNPRRQASNAIRGYLFQIWHTVHVWIDLHEDEVLHLEGVEDIDLMGPSGTTTIQIKDRQSPVSLRSESVLRSIESYWALRQQASSPVRLIYLTTAETAVEQGAPFGPGVPGLVAWSQARRDEQVARQLCVFLAEEARLNPDLRNSLRERPIEELQSGLFQRIEWLTSSGKASAVERAVMRQLVMHGEALGFRPDESMKAVDRLLRRAWETAARASDRRLERFDFQVEFEEAITIRGTSKELRRAGLTPGTVETGPGPLEASSTATSLASPFGASPPPVTGAVASRGPLVETCLRALDRDGLVVLCGSSGMGKSTLAKLIASASQRSWLWFDLRSTGTDFVARVLRYTEGAVDQVARTLGIVIDGLEQVSGDPRAIGDQLCVLLYTLRARGHSVVITSQKPLPRRLLGGLDLSGACNFEVPRFASEDVLELARELSCPDERATKYLAAVVLLQTSGHPQLVYARLLGLRDREWQVPSPREVFEQPQELAEERLRERQRLMELLPEDQTELIYRLSLFSGPFRRDHAVVVASFVPPIARPGDAFDPLVGPWIEPVSTGYFRLSPLISTSGTEVWSQDRQNRLRSAIAATVLRCKPVSLVEAAEALLQGLIAQAPEPVITVAGSLLGESKQALRAAAEQMPWFAHMSRIAGQPLMDDPRANFAARALQFQVVAVARPELVPAVGDAWDQESQERKPDSDFIPERLYVISQLCLYHEQLEGARLVALLGQLMELVAAQAGSGEVFPELLPPSLGATPDIATELFRLAAFRNASPRFLADLVTAMAGAPVPLRDRMLAAYRTRPEDGWLLIDRTWTSEERKGQPQWDQCIDALALTAHSFQDWGFPELAAVAYSRISVVHDEYLDDEPAALEVLRAGEERLGLLRPLAEQRATVCLNRKRYAEALELLDSLYPDNTPAPTADDFRPMLGARKGGEAAGHVGDWLRAARFFLTAEAFVHEPQNALSAAGLAADAGYAFWKCGRHRDALRCFGRSLHGLESAPDSPQQLGRLVVSKRVGHVLLWVWRELEGGAPGELAVPLPGMCSDPSRPEQFKDLPPSSLEGSWMVLAEIEYRLAGGREFFHEAARRLGQNPILLFETRFVILDLRYSLADNETARAAEQCVQLNAVMQAHQRGRESGQEALLAPWKEAAPDEKAFSADVLLGFLVGLAASHRFDHVETVLSQWETVARTLVGAGAVQSWVAQAKVILRLALPDAHKIMADSEEPSTRRLLSALNMAGCGQSGPEGDFYAHALLFDWQRKHLFREELALSLVQVVTVAWQRHCTNPAALRSPRLTVPPILQACAESGPPAQRIARILLAARDAVSVRMSDEASKALTDSAK